jgi:hypothetical protein
MNAYDLAGLTGAALILTAFAGVQTRRLDPHRPPALLLNLFGPSLVLVSLVDKPNAAALVLQIAWIAVSLHGLSRLLFRRS